MHQPPPRSPAIDDGSRSILADGRGGDRRPNAAASASGDQAGGAEIRSRETRFGHWPLTRPGFGWFVISVDFVDCGVCEYFRVGADEEPERCTPGTILRHSHATISRLALHYSLDDQEDGATGELRSKVDVQYFMHCKALIVIFFGESWPEDSSHPERFCPILAIMALLCHSSSVLSPRALKPLKMFVRTRTTLYHMAHQGYGVAKLRNSGIGEWTHGLLSLAESSQLRQR
ncbi:hypothetical protein AKJ16_DCAP17022 [Drosera capensis]